MYVYDGGAAGAFRDAAAAWFLTRPDSARLTRPEFRARVDRLADAVQRPRFAAALAPGRPAFLANLTGALVPLDS